MTTINDTQKYISGIDILGNRVIPSDTFELGDTEYVLLKILFVNNEHHLRIMGISGSDSGSIYMVPKKEFEEKSIDEIVALLADYKNNQ